MFSRNKNTNITNILKLPVVALIGAAVTLGSTAGAAHAESEIENSNQSSMTRLAVSQVDPNTTADRVQRSKTAQEAKQILESEGFLPLMTAGQGLGSVRYEKIVEGVAVGFSLPDPSIAQPLMSGGWNWGNGGPYLKGTVSEWQDLAASGTIVGGAACAFITATVGTAACVAAAGLVNQWIGSQDPANLPSGVCIAIAPTSSNVWIEQC